MLRFHRRLDYRRFLRLRLDRLLVFWLRLFLLLLLRLLGLDVALLLQIVRLRMKERNQLVVREFGLRLARV